jgi:hypothetical protein
MDEARTGQRVVTVGATSTVVSRLSPIARRVQFVLTNASTGGQTISISLSQEAVAGQGIVLSPGGFYAESTDSGFVASNEDIYAIASGAGGSLAVSERVLTRNV